MIRKLYVLLMRMLSFGMNFLKSWTFMNKMSYYVCPCYTVTVVSRKQWAFIKCVQIHPAFVGNSITFVANRNMKSCIIWVVSCHNTSFMLCIQAVLCEENTQEIQLLYLTLSFVILIVWAISWSLNICKIGEVYCDNRPLFFLWIVWNISKNELMGGVLQYVTNS